MHKKQTFRIPSNIMWHLATRCEVGQKCFRSTFKETYGASARTVRRNLHVLRGLGWIRRYTRNNKEAGKDPVIWQITFPGLIVVLPGIRNEDIVKIAKKHQDKWLVFDVWDYLSSNSQIMENILSYIHHFPLTGLNLLTENPKALRNINKKIDLTVKNVSEKHNEGLLRSSEVNDYLWVELDKIEGWSLTRGMSYRNATIKALGLDQVFLHRNWIKEFEGLQIARMIKFYLGNARLRKFIEKELERWENEGASMIQFKDWFSQVTAPFSQG